MIDLGKRNVLGVLVDAVDYEGAVERVLDAAREPRGMGVTALAVHGVMEAVADARLRYRVNDLDLVTPDGQPVRWGMNLLHRTRLPDRVYGPTLTLRLLERAAADRVPVFFYGSTGDVVTRLAREMQSRYPDLVVAGSEPSLFRPATPPERDAIAARVRASGARLVFVGLGCPRQEVFVHDLRDRVGLPVLAVGAAFEYHSGVRREPPAVLQRAGLQWLWRLLAEPRRLWRRYLSTNPAFVARVVLQRLGVWRPATSGERPPDGPIAA